METTLEVLPAYGRDYKSKAEVQKDWDENKDFRIATLSQGGRYINREDARRSPGLRSIQIRYAKLTKVHVIKL